MKRKIRKTVLVAVLVGAMLIPTLPARAGSSVTIVDTTSYEAGLDDAAWYDADGDIVVEKGVLIFPNDSSSSTKLMSKAVVDQATQIDKMLSAEFTVNFTSLPEGQKFIFALGLQSLSSDWGQAGNVELVFLKDGGTQKAGLSAYAEDGVETTLARPTSCGNGSVNVSIELSTSQKLKVTVGGRKIFDGSIPVSGQGSVGFLQTGSCGARISNFVYTCFKYDTPECPDIMEDFETGFYNKNVLKSNMITGSSYTPSQMIIKDFNGSKVLMFENTKTAYVTTQYAYSNFELTFDVPFFRREALFDENDDVIAPKTDIMGISFGEDSQTSDYITATDMFCLAGPGGGYRVPSNKGMSNGLKDPSNVEPFSVRLTVIDGFVKFETKLKKDANYTEMISYQLEQTPTGYIKIWAPSGQVCNFAIDNFKLINKDVDGKKIDVEYKSSEIPQPDDFAYEPLGWNYNPDAVSSDDVKKSKINPVILSVAAVCVLSLGVTSVVYLVKSRRRKERAVDEE